MSVLLNQIKNIISFADLISDRMVEPPHRLNNDQRWIFQLPVRPSPGWQACFKGSYAQSANHAETSTNMNIEFIQFEDTEHPDYFAETILRIAFA